jgi:uncharacterized protein YkwD
MANKIALLLLGGIVVAAATAGAAIGMYVGDGGPLLGSGDGGGAADPTPTAAGAAESTPGDGDGRSTATPGSAGTPSPTASPTATGISTRTAAPTPVPPSSFNETEIGLLVVDAINDRRVERGLWKLRPDEVLTRMAANHSRRMGEQRYVSHAAGGFTTEERYRRNGMYDACRIADDTNTGLRTGDAIETLAKVSAGERFANRTNTDEREVALDAVEGWFAEDTPRRKLTYENAGQLGVGVHVTGNNRAYLTVDLCS